MLHIPLQFFVDYVTHIPMKDLSYFLDYVTHTPFTKNKTTGGSRLSWIFWEHENQSGLLVIWLIYIKLYRKRETKFWKKIWAKRESGLTAVQLKGDPPVIT